MSSLARLIAPSSVAIFGGNWAESVVNQLHVLGFKGEIWPVHPYREQMAGQHCFRNISDLPSAPDASFIGVNRKLSVDILAELAARDSGGAVCFASGFAEAEAEDEKAPALQEALVNAAGDMPFLGPNCYGFVNYLDRTALWPDQHGGIATDNGVAIITQSSNMAISLSMQNRSLPIGFLGTAGNQACISQAKLALHLLEDERISAIGLHIEGFGNLADWQNLAEKSRALCKPVICLKVGTSEQAQQATFSHTASLAGTMAGAKALMARLDFGITWSLPVFLESLKLAHFAGPLKSNKICTMSCSGGEASLAADTAKTCGLEFPPLSASQQTQLRSALGPLVHLANPLDYQTYIWGQTEVMTDAFATMLSGSQTLGALILDLPRTDRCDEKAWQAASTAFIQAHKRTTGIAAVIATLPELLTETQAKPFIDAGIIPLCGLQEGLAAIRVMVDIAERWEKPSEPPVLEAAQISSRKDKFIDEADAKTLLSDVGVRCPLGKTVKTPKEAEKAATQIGFPIVLKSRGLSHKTEAGGVYPNLKSLDEVRAALIKMPSDKGYLVEEHISQPLAELLIGIRRDTAHGFLLTLGHGGTYAEIMQDTANVLLPVSSASIENALRSLKIWPLLTGFRGAPVAPLDKVIGTIEKLVKFTERHQENILELEVNPCLILSDEAIVVDVLIRFGENGEDV